MSSDIDNQEEYVILAASADPEVDPQVIGCRLTQSPIISANRYRIWQSLDFGAETLREAYCKGSIDKDKTVRSRVD